MVTTLVANVLCLRLCIRFAKKVLPTDVARIPSSTTLQTMPNNPNLRQCWFCTDETGWRRETERNPPFDKVGQRGEWVVSVPRGSVRQRAAALTLSLFPKKKSHPRRPLHVHGTADRDVCVALTTAPRPQAPPLFVYFRNQKRPLRRNLFPSPLGVISG